MTWKFMQIKPQKARGSFREALWTDPSYVAEEKYDGDRRIAQFCGKVIRFTGTRESVDGTGFVEKTGCLPHLSGLGESSDAMRAALRTLEGTVLDGEVVPPLGKEIRGGRSKYVTSIMGSKPDEALRKQREGGFLCYAVFDCLFWKGTDVRHDTFVHRQHLALRAVRAWGNSYVSHVESYTACKREYYDLIIKQGGEGVVLKRLDQKYGDESLWVKVKGEGTADVVVMGFKPGKGKYKNMAGAIIFGQFVTKDRIESLDRLGTARGFTDAQMRALSPKDMGRVFRVKHNGREPTGAFRHPRFDSWRDDKSPRDCVYREDEI